MNASVYCCKTFSSLSVDNPHITFHLDNNLPQNTNKGYTIGSFIPSRFIIATLGMLTMEHQLVDLSLMLNQGLLGLTQSLIRLTATVQKQDKHSGEEEVETKPVEAPPTSPKAVPVTGPELIHRMRVGTKVVRGPDWKWVDQVGMVL